MPIPVAIIAGLEIGAAIVTAISVVKLADKIEEGVYSASFAISQKLEARKERKAAETAPVAEKKAKAAKAKTVIKTGAVKSSKKEIAAHQAKRRAISGVK